MTLCIIADEHLLTINQEVSGSSSDSENVTLHCKINLLFYIKFLFAFRFNIFIFVKKTTFLSIMNLFTCILYFNKNMSINIKK